MKYNNNRLSRSELKKRFKEYYLHIRPTLSMNFGIEPIEENYERAFQEELITELRKNDPNFTLEKAREFAKTYAIRIKSIESGLPLSDDTTTIEQDSESILSDLVEEEFFQVQEYATPAPFQKRFEVSNEDIENIRSIHKQSPNYKESEEQNIILKVEQRINEIGLEKVIEKGGLTPIAKEVIYGPIIEKEIPDHIEDLTSIPPDSEIIENGKYMALSESSFFELNIKPIGNMLKDQLLRIMVEHGEIIKKGEIPGMTIGVIKSAQEIAHENADGLGISHEDIDKNAERLIKEYEFMPKYSEEELKRAAEKLQGWFKEQITTLEIPAIKDRIREEHYEELPNDTLLQLLGMNYIKEKSPKPKRKRIPKKPSELEKELKTQEHDLRRSVPHGDPNNYHQKKVTKIKPIKYIIAAAALLGAISLPIALYSILTKKEPQVILSKEAGKIAVEDIVDKKIDAYDNLQNKTDENQYDILKLIEHKQILSDKKRDDLSTKVKNQGNEIEQIKTVTENTNNKLKKTNDKLDSTITKVEINTGLEKATAQDITKLFGSKDELRDISTIDERVTKVEKEQKGLKESNQELRKKYKALPDEVVREVEKGFKEYLKTIKDTTFEQPKQEPPKVVETPEEPEKLFAPKIKITEDLKRKVRAKIKKLKNR